MASFLFSLDLVAGSGGEASSSSMLGKVGHELTDAKPIRVRVKIKDVLNEMRKQAFELVADQDYVKAGPKYGELQQEMDRLVNGMKAYVKECGFIQVSKKFRIAARKFDFYVDNFSKNYRSHEDEVREMENLRVLVNAQSAATNILEFPVDAYEAQIAMNNKRVSLLNEQFFKEYMGKENGLNSVEYEHLRIMNDYRELMGLQRLVADNSLIDAARGHSDLMLRKQMMWHNGENGTPATRAKDAGFGGNFIGENVAYGKEGAYEVFDQWYRSPGHHRNMLRGEYNSIGVARSANYWTQLFGNSEREELLVMK